MEELRTVRDRLLTLLGLLSGTLAVGTAGYHAIEGWPFFDALYMTVITLGTVGYGETHPLSHAGRVFTILLILGGIGVMTYAFSTITSILVEGELSGALKRRRMDKEIGKLQGHYIVCGAGHAGSVIASELARTQRPFVLIDKSAESLARFTDRLGKDGYFTLEGDATEDEVLKKAGAERAAGVFAVLHTDQDNAFVALSAKGLNPKVRVVSAQKELGVREKLFRSGADNVVNPEYIGGLRMASEMVRPAVVGFLDSMIREKAYVCRFEEIDVPAKSGYIGQPLERLASKEPGSPLLVAVQSTGATKYDLNPSLSRPIAAGDKLVLVGEIGQLSALRKTVEEG